MSCQRSLRLTWDVPRICDVTFFAVEVDVTRFAIGVLGELLYADDLVLMSVAIDGLGGKFRKWEESFEGNRLKVNFLKSKVIISGRYYKGWFV